MARVTRVRVTALLLVWGLGHCTPKGPSTMDPEEDQPVPEPTSLHPLPRGAALAADGDGAVEEPNVTPFLAGHPSRVPGQELASQPGQPRIRQTPLKDGA